MKASSSPSPLDRISVICIKHCPYLRSFLTEVIKIVWSSGCALSEWKKACTILIHKKGDTNDPSNFRPITLQLVGRKIFTSCLRDSIFVFIRINGFVENKIQKGFTHKVSGTLEHTAMMGNIINKARIKQRSLVITLLDLKNAFGEVHHNLTSPILSYHHVIKDLNLFLDLKADLCHFYIMSLKNNLSIILGSKSKSFKNIEAQEKGGYSFNNKTLCR